MPRETVANGVMVDKNYKIASIHDQSPPGLCHVLSLEPSIMRSLEDMRKPIVSVVHAIDELHTIHQVNDG